MKLKNYDKPIGKTDNLIMQEVADEVLIYNLNTHKAYNLNRTSSAVWRNCDGSKDLSAVTRALQTKFKKPVSEDVVWLALEDLKKEGLIEFDAPADFNGINRREVIKRAALSSMIALPIIASLVAPTAASAASLASVDACDVNGTGGIGADRNKTLNNGACKGNGNCCSNNCCATAGGTSGVCQPSSTFC